MASDIERYRKFGNNYFTLETPSGEFLYGVLLELPSFNFSTKWEESPAAAMGEELYKLVNKPEIEYLASTVQGGRVMRRTGNLTSKVYETADPVSFELKFRCYPGQSFGDDEELSKAEDWIDVLKNTTTISTDAGISVDRVVTNLTGAIQGGGNQIFGIVDDVKKMFNNENTEEKTLSEKISAINEKIGLQRQKEKGTIYENSAKESKTMNELKTEREKLKSELRKQGNALTKKLNDISKKYNERVKNSVNNFGASLFKLTLYPFIFKNPFIVYISSWTVKPSKEYNENKYANFYYDFSISCTMDRVLSAKTWDSEYLT